MDPLTIVAAVLVAVLGVGRLARVIIYDAFPPAAWLRAKWADLMWDRQRQESNPWGLLLNCPWCLIPWIMAACIGWFFGGLAIEWVAWSWWLFWGWLALAYVSSMVYVRDERP